MLGPVMVDLQGDALTNDEITLLKHPLVGGVVLFTRNYQSSKQLMHLTSTIHALRSPQLLIVTDQEGGVVQRFQQDFTQLPAMADLGKLEVQDSIAAAAQAETLGYTMASELKGHGVDLSLAPVLDLNRGISKALAHDRAIAATPAVVTRLAKAYIDGMHGAQMAATGKHFPGHGAVTTDSHVDIATDKRSLVQIMETDMQPFVKLIVNDLQAIMPAHIIFPKVDAMPASLSSVWLKNILRQQLAFTGMVFSDCLSMQGSAAIVQDVVARAELALTAGCDMILVCNDRPAVLTLLKHLQPPDNDKLATRIEMMRCYQRN